MKIHAISDTHGFHNRFVLGENIDTFIHAGDSTNSNNLIKNELEFNSFFEWLVELPVKNKIIIGGNHDFSLNKQYIKEKLKNNGIHYLEHEYLELDGIKFFGSPYTPTFGQWNFMKDRSKISKYWGMVTESIDILITHGPPKGVLDLSYDRNHDLDVCGDLALLKMINRIKPKYHLFGHIHDNEDIINRGILIRENVTFMNISSVKDGRFEKGLISNGQIFTI